MIIRLEIAFINVSIVLSVKARAKIKTETIIKTLLFNNINLKKAKSGTISESIEKDIRPLDLLTKEAFENAISVVMAVGGSTNAVLHLLAIARTANVNLSIDDFERIRQKVPVICDLKPSGKYLMEDLHNVGGVPGVMKYLLDLVSEESFDGE